MKPDPAGEWLAESIYQSAGYNYETFVVLTNNLDSAKMLDDPDFRRLGMSKLPVDTIIISNTVTVLR